MTNISIQYLEDELDNVDYIDLIKHEFIHIKLYYLCRKNMNPCIESKQINRNGIEYFEGVCDINLNYVIVDIFVVLRVLICSVASMLYDIIYYIFNNTYYLMYGTIIKHIGTILLYVYIAIGGNVNEKDN